MRSAKTSSSKIALCDRASAASGASVLMQVVTLSPDELQDLGLPPYYQVKICALCGNHSASPNPFLGHPDVAAWKKVLPWGSGTMIAPRGELCRICNYVFVNGGFTFLFDKIRDYIKHVKSHPEDSAEFLQARDLYIHRKTEQPGLQLKGSKELWPERIVRLQKEKQKSIHRPKQYLMELEEYIAKFGEPSPDRIETRTFDGEEIKGVLVTREQDKGMWLLSESESQSVQVDQQCSEMHFVSRVWCDAIIVHGSYSQPHHIVSALELKLEMQKLGCHDDVTI